MVCQSRARLLHVAQVGARRAVELRRYDVRLGKTVQMPPLVVIVVDTEALVACAHTVLALSEVAEADMCRIARALLRDDVHDAAHRLAAVEDRSRPFDYLDAFDLIGRDLVEIVLAAPRDGAAVHEHERAALEAAHVQLVVHRSHRSTGRAEGFVGEAVDLGERVRRIGGAALLDGLACDDHGCRRHVNVALFAARRRHDGIFERMIVFCRCDRRSRRLFLCCLTRLLRHLRRPSGGGCRHKCSRDGECEHLLLLALQNIPFFHKFSSNGNETSSSRRRAHRRHRD